MYLQSEIKVTKGKVLYTLQAQERGTLHTCFPLYKGLSYLLSWSLFIVMATREK